jgi:hypothetical protein
MHPGVRSFLRKLARRRPAGPPPLQPDDAELVARVREQRLTYLSDTKIRSLLHACRSVESAGVPGLFIEAGCALGGSLVLMAHAKPNDRPLLGYDVFGMIPAPTDDDPADVHERYRTIRAGQAQGIDGDKYYGYEADLYHIVQNNLRRFGVDLERQRVSLVKGLVQDTMHIDQPVALAHIDVDWYDPVKTCLERIEPHLGIGGVLILDDYNDWGGCRKAADEFFGARASQFRLDDTARSLSATRIALAN